MVDELQFFQAKARPSALMDEVIHRDQLKAVRHDRGTDEVTCLLPRGLIAAAVEPAHVMMSS